MTEKPENIRTILTEELDGAAQTAEFTFDLFETSINQMFDRVKTEVNLLDVVANRGGRDFKSFIQATVEPGQVLSGRHSLREFIESIGHGLKPTGNEANQLIVIRLSHGCRKS